MLTSSLLLAVFLGALVSGWHCALMCGGIAAAIERPSRAQDASITLLQSKSQLFYLQFIMHLGRLTTYMLLGSLAAWIGVVVWQQNLVPVQRPLFAFTSLILILMGIRLLRQGSGKPLLLGKWLGSKMASYWAKYLGHFASGSSRWFSCLLYTSDAADE